MLDAFIIEELKRRERLQHQEGERPGLEIPIPHPEERPARRSDTEREETPQRGVVVIDL